ncbi:hypothetical protein ABID52_000071 [Fictibacillus halophilus]|uniref:Uncharacterized protein n=1 Tax=Fictibacillus halophilus TaxID=1610490 RepID=A0ABV2LD13_9BACL
MFISRIFKPLLIAEEVFYFLLERVQKIGYGGMYVE